MNPAPLWQRVDRWDLARVALVTACALLLLAGLKGPWTHVPLVALLGLAVGCWPILAESWESIRHRRMSMELSMLLAIVAAAVIGEWVTALLVTTFVLAAEILEDLSLDRGRDALSDLMAFLPTEVLVREGNTVRPLALDQLQVGQTVVVPPGGRVPVDGTVRAGNSTLDQSRITGESIPVDVEAGAAVFAGSVNQVGALEIEAEKVGAASSYGQIIEAVRQAQESTAPVQKLADRLAAYLVYLALAAAVLTYCFSRDITATIAVVIVAGACGVAAGTPLAILAAIASAARSGAFIKDGRYLEALSSVDTVVFDKTGTLTSGSPAVVAVHALAGYTESEVLALAAAAELYSEHPLGQAIVAQARHLELVIDQPETFEYQPGLGLSAHVKDQLVQVGRADLIGASLPPHLTHLANSGTPVWVAVNGQFIGVIELADPIRTSAQSSVTALQALGMRVIMLTGDTPAQAHRVATELGVNDVRAGLLPDQKLAAVRSERAAGHRVAMVGDGVNDAPALALADTGIAMGSGTEIARHSADLVLISADLDDLVNTIRIAQRARRIVQANFIGTITVDLIGMALAGWGLLSPVLAAVIHVGSESAFILNSARLIPRRTRATTERVRQQEIPTPVQVKR